MGPGSVVPSEATCTSSKPDGAATTPWPTASRSARGRRSRDIESTPVIRTAVGTHSGLTICKSLYHETSGKAPVGMPEARQEGDRRPGRQPAVAAHVPERVLNQGPA